MLAVDIALIIVVLLVAGSIVYTVNTKAALRAANRPNAALAQAMRIIDRMLTVDEVSPTIPRELRSEAQALLNRYYKEIEQA